MHDAVAKHRIVHAKSCGPKYISTVNSTYVSVLQDRVPPESSGG